jgi:hypothetical protein
MERSPRERIIDETPRDAETFGRVRRYCGGSEPIVRPTELNNELSITARVVPETEWTPDEAKGICQ